jgi:hypothetical protein
MNARDLWAFGLVAVLVVAGCTEKALPRAEGYDSSAAREALVTSLDAWKTKDVRSLAARKPPIRFVDDDEKAGLRLSTYVIDDSAPEGPFSGFGVTLSLRNVAGELVVRSAQYQVSLEPGISVLRSDP